jgi:hypothetical protein
MPAEGRSSPVEIQKHFAGDADSTVQGIQERTCPRIIELLYSRPRQEYLATVGCSERPDDKLFNAIENKTTFEHDVLVPAYDRIAAGFRFKNTDVWQTSLFSAGDSASDDSPSRLEKVERDWLSFYRSECEAVAHHGEMARAVLNAVGFAHLDRGEDALRALLDLLDARYRAMTKARKRWGQFQEMREFCDW